MFKKLLEALELKFLHWSLNETQTEIQNEIAQHNAMVNHLRNKKIKLLIKIENIEIKNRAWQ
jgi:hypothetical protein